MARFVLVPGAGSDSWYWHRVVPLLAAAGHDPVAIDLPLDDPNAGFVPEYVDAVVDACAGASDGLAIIGQSLGGFTASAACAQVDADLLGLVCAMVPAPGETFDAWWTNTGFEEPEDWDIERMFLHDVPADVAAAIGDHAAESVGRGFDEPWPLDRWPDVRTRFVLATGDRLFPAAFQRRVVAERLPGVVPDEIDTGHLPALARPDGLTALLLGWWAA